MKKDGIALPAWVEKMRASERDRLLQADGNRVWDLDRSAATTRRATIDPREVTFEIMRKGNAPVLKNAGAEAWDLGDGVLGLTFKTKANSIDADVIKMIHDAVERAERDFRAMVIWNQGEFFCVGANLFARRDGRRPEAVGSAARDDQGLPVRDAADEVRDACRSSPRRTT